MTINENRLIAIFCLVDDFCKLYESALSKKLLSHTRKRIRKTSLSLSEMLTIAIIYHLSPVKEFKYYYREFICTKFKGYFGTMSYNRFVQLMPRILVPMTFLLHLLKGEKTGIYFIDSTKLSVCHNKRINRNKVFSGIAEIGKSSYGWFFGFKLNLVINHHGEIIAIKITKGNVDDRIYVKDLTNGLKGAVYADKGYISQNLFIQLFATGLKLVHNVKSNMKNRLMLLIDKIMLRKRSIIESVFNHMKHRMNLEHTRHRSVINFFVNTISCLTAYCLTQNKPSIIKSLRARLSGC